MNGRLEKDKVAMRRDDLKFIFRTPKQLFFAFIGAET
jgi:hypothetical protein